MKIPWTQKVEPTDAGIHSPTFLSPTVESEDSTSLSKVPGQANYVVILPMSQK